MAQAGTSRRSCAGGLRLRLLRQRLGRNARRERSIRSHGRSRRVFRTGWFEWEWRGGRRGNGTFSDECDSSGDLIDYKCESTQQSVGGGSDPGAAIYTVTGMVTSVSIPCGGGCVSGTCVGVCPELGDTMRFVSIDAESNAVLEDLRTGWRYACPFYAPESCRTTPPAPGTEARVARHARLPDLRQHLDQRGAGQEHRVRVLGLHPARGLSGASSAPGRTFLIAPPAMAPPSAWPRSLVWLMLIRFPDMRTFPRYTLCSAFLLLVACSSKSSGDDDDASAGAGSGGSGNTSGASGASSGGSSAASGGSTASGGASGAAGKGMGGGAASGGPGTGGNGGSTAGAAPGGSGGGGGTTSGSAGMPQGGTAGSGGTTSGGAGMPQGGTGGGGTNGIPPLHVEGPKLVDAGGNTVVLRGIDFIDLGQVYAYADHDFGAVKTRIDKILAAGFEPKVVRIPVYPRVSHNGNYPYASPYPFPSGAGGQQNGPSADQYVSDLLDPSVDYFTEKGYYVILDFHQIDDTDGDSASEATAFWQYMAPKYADRSNVLYEPFNEPMDASTPWATFKPRAQAWVDTIRSAAPANIVIVPSMSWCQKPGDASSSPLTGENLMYTMHIYPGNWDPTTEQQLATATAKVPVFITEWGYILASNDAIGGTNDPMWFANFRSTVDGNGASWSAWVTDNGWAPPMFTDANFTSLNDFGTKTKQWLAETNAP